MADLKNFLKRYNLYISTFKLTSFDSENNYYLCRDETKEVIDFDKIIAEKFTDSNKRPKSFDAIYIHENSLYCIEFKNQKPGKIDNEEIQGKLEEGKKELIHFLKESKIDIKKINFIYAVVYKECKSNFEKYKCGLVQSKIEFGLEKFKKSGFVKDVFTSDIAFFKRAFKLKMKEELAC